VAKARGIAQGEPDLSEGEKLRIIFAPGFSTAEVVSDLSGRGVGLDVVETAVDQLGGKILVRSEVGAGTTFELIIPFTKPSDPA
jgi:two-component system chemotaxis sensor kinase CheA